VGFNESECFIVHTQKEALLDTGHHTKR